MSASQNKAIPRRITDEAGKRGTRSDEPVRHRLPLRGAAGPPEEGQAGGDG